MFTKVKFFLKGVKFTSSLLLIFLVCALAIENDKLKNGTETSKPETSFRYYKPNKTRTACKSPKYPIGFK